MTEPSFKTMIGLLDESIEELRSKPKLNPLRCPCSHHDIVAKYDDTHVEIKGKHGCYAVLEVIDGKLVERKPTTSSNAIVSIIK